MEKKKAYEIFGLDESATEEEIICKYREIALNCHPDRNPDLNDEEMKSLNEAKEILLGASRDQYLPQVRMANEVMRHIESNLQVQKYRDKANDVFKYTIEKSKKKYQYMKVTLSGASIFFGALSFISTQMTTVIKAFYPEPGIVTLAFTIAAAYLAIIYYSINTMVQRRENKISQVREKLKSKRCFFLFLYSISNHISKKISTYQDLDALFLKHEWSDQDLERAVMVWKISEAFEYGFGDIYNLLTFLDPEDLCNNIIAIGLESGFIKEKESLLENLYSVNVPKNENDQLLHEITQLALSLSHESSSTN